MFHPLLHWGGCICKKNLDGVYHIGHCKVASMASVINASMTSEINGEIMNRVVYISCYECMNNKSIWMITTCDINLAMYISFTLISFQFISTLLYCNEYFTEKIIYLWDNTHWFSSLLLQVQQHMLVVGEVGATSSDVRHVRLECSSQEQMAATWSMQIRAPTPGNQPENGLLHNWFVPITGQLWFQIHIQIISTFKLLVHESNNADMPDTSGSVCLKV